MATGRSGENQGEGLTALKFWVMFVVGLVIVLSLFRGFMGGVENEKVKEAELVVKKKRRGKRTKHEHQD